MKLAHAWLRVNRNMGKSLVEVWNRLVEYSHLCFLESVGLFSQFRDLIDFRNVGKRAI